MNCKTESYFFIMFIVVGRIWIFDGPRVEVCGGSNQLNYINKNEFRTAI